MDGGREGGREGRRGKRRKRGTYCKPGVCARGAVRLGGEEG